MGIWFWSVFGEPSEMKKHLFNSPQEVTQGLTGRLASNSCFSPGTVPGRSQIYDGKKITMRTFRKQLLSLRA